MMQGKLKLEYRPIAKLKPFAGNANVHPPEQIDKLVALIKTLGWTNPILVDGKNGIIAGHGRLQAALQLQMRTVPVIELAGLSAAEKRAYVLADNRIAQDAGWDKTLLRTEFGALKDMGMDLNLTGFDKDEIEGVLSLQIQENPEPPVPALPAHAVTKKGDVWILGEHRLMCGDATSEKDWDALTSGHRMQMIFTDPPYGVSYEARSGVFEMIKGDDMRRGQLSRMLSESFHQAARHALDDAAWYVWHASATRDDFAKALRDQGLVELGTIIWAKPAMVLGWSDYRWSHEPCLYCAKQGIRAAEGGRRAHAKVFEDVGGELYIHRPILRWTAADCFEAMRYYGLKPNPLYKLGGARVGCMPCINCSKEELTSIAKRFPEHIDRIEQWEAAVGAAGKRAGHSSFFPAPEDGRADLQGRNIRERVIWASTSRGGRQFMLYADEPPPPCSSSYGLCEAPDEAEA